MSPIICQRSAIGVSRSTAPCGGKRAPTDTYSRSRKSRYHVPPRGPRPEAKTGSAANN